MQPEQPPILAAELAAKACSKTEMYRFLTTDGNAYLPPRRCITTYFMGDLFTGKKKGKCQF